MQSPTETIEYSTGEEEDDDNNEHKVESDKYWPENTLDNQGASIGPLKIVTFGDANFNFKLGKDFTWLLTVHPKQENRVYFEI